MFYAMSAIPYPRYGSISTFEKIRTPFYTALLVYFVLGVPYYDAAKFDRPSFYWYTVIPFFGLFVVAIPLRRRTLDATLAVLWFFGWSAWWFITQVTE